MHSQISCHQESMVISVIDSSLFSSSGSNNSDTFRSSSSMISRSRYLRSSTESACSIKLIACFEGISLTISFRLAQNLLISD